MKKHLGLDKYQEELAQRQMKTKKKPTLYNLQKLTNSVIKWTGILSSYCKKNLD